MGFPSSFRGGQRGKELYRVPSRENRGKLERQTKNRRRRAYPQMSDFEELLSCLQAAGYDIKRGKYISCRALGQERFTRLKTIDADYTEEAITERIKGKRSRITKAPKQQHGGINLLIDIQNSIKAQESRGYEQWAKIHNLKQAAGSLKDVEKRFCGYGVFD